MRLNRANVLTISLLFALTVSVVDAEPVSTYVRLEATNAFNHRYVNFYNGTFKRLYDCMTDAHNGQCNVDTEYEASARPHPGENFKAINVRALQAARLDQSYFTCVYNQNTNTLMCTRYNTSQCGNDCISFRLHSSSICDNECVYMKKYPDEQLLDIASDNFEDCNPACTQTSTMHSPNVPSTEPSSYTRVTSKLPSDQTSEATTNSSNASNIANTGTRNNSTDEQLPIIIGVVCSLVVIIILIAVGIIYRRRKLVKRHDGISPSHADANYNVDLTRPSTITSNISDIPGVLTTLPHSVHGSDTNPESEDGYDTFDEDYERIRYENTLSTLSSGTYQVLERATLSSHGLNDYQNVLSSSSQ